jgi:hypothetical protein
MSKKTKKSVAGAATLSPEEFQKLTPEEQYELLNKAQGEAAALAEENKKLVVSKGKPELPSIEVDDDEDNDIEGGEYQFTAPTFTWDDNTVIAVKDLVAGLGSKDKRVKEKAEDIVAKLVARKSGLLLRLGKEEKENE